VLFGRRGGFSEKFIESHSRRRSVGVALPDCAGGQSSESSSFRSFSLWFRPPGSSPCRRSEVGVLRTGTRLTSNLPQHFADEFGWGEMVAPISEIYNAMPADERAKTASLAGNYGSAGAIDFFGRRYGLAPSISAHQNYLYDNGDSGNTPPRV
jgi:hypothetical protein